MQLKLSFKNNDEYNLKYFSSPALATELRKPEASVSPVQLLQDLKTEL